MATSITNAFVKSYTPKRKRLRPKRRKRPDKRKRLRKRASSVRVSKPRTKKGKLSA